MIPNDSRDPHDGTLHYVTMQITFLTRKFRNGERNLHCDVVHISTVWVSSLTVDCNGVFAIKDFAKTPLQSRVRLDTQTAVIYVCVCFQRRRDVTMQITDLTGGHLRVRNLTCIVTNTSPLRITAVWVSFWIKRSQRSIRRDKGLWPLSCFGSMLKQTSMQRFFRHACADPCQSIVCRILYLPL